MGDHSAIEWTDATWNPVTGCTKVSAGCKHCYAERIAPRVFAGQTVVDSTCRVKEGNPFERPRRFTDVRCHPERLDQPLRWRKPRRVFVNSMSDLFHEDVPDGFVCKVFDTMMMAERHTFQILTKRPERMQRFVEFYVRAMECPPLPNVHLYVSCENQETADQRIPILLQTPASVRGVSAEPLLGPIDMRPPLLGPLTGTGPMNTAVIGLPPLDHVIVGGESGPKARQMDLDWLRSIVDQCRAAGVPVFVKQDSGPRAGQQGRIPDDLWELKGEVVSS